jgi:hypothetical protein
MVFSRYSGFIHHLNWLPRYKWNIVESGIKHHNPIPNPEIEWIQSTWRKPLTCRKSLANFTCGYWIDKGTHAKGVHGENNTPHTQTHTLFYTLILLWIFHTVCSFRWPFSSIIYINTCTHTHVTIQVLTSSMKIVLCSSHMYILVWCPFIYPVPTRCLNDMNYQLLIIIQ